MLQLHLWRYCHNIISEIKGELYTFSGQAPHPFAHPMKTSWCAPIICLRVSRNFRSKQRLCPWTALSSWSLLRRRLVFSVRYELCMLYSVVTELMLRDMPRSLWQWWSAVRCWLFGGHNCQFVRGEQSNEVCQMWSGCSGSLQCSRSCSMEPQRNTWLLNRDVITFVQTFLKMKSWGRLCLGWALSVLGCVGTGAWVVWKLTSILYGLDDRGVLVWLAAEAEILSSQCPDPRLGPTQPFVQWIAGILHPYN